MKKLLLFCAALFSLSTAYGQRAHFGVRAGFTVSDLIIDGRGFDTHNRYSNSSRVEYVTDYLYTGHVGFLVEIPLAKKFYLEPGAQLTFLGTEYRNVKHFYGRDSDYSRDYYYEGDKVHITQLNLPLWFKFNAVAGLRPKVGAYVGYLASVRERRRSTSSKIEGRYLNSDFDFGLGAGVEYHFRTGFFLDTNINIGLANLSARGEVQNIFLQTGVGYKF